HRNTGSRRLRRGRTPCRRGPARRDRHRDRRVAAAPPPHRRPLTVISIAPTRPSAEDEPMTIDAPTAPEPSEVALVAQAVDGNPDAVARILRDLQDPIYRLALRMTGRPADAEDATQEILLRVFTRLAMWRGEAKLLTWAYR